MNLKSYFKIKDTFDLCKLINLGFEKIDYNNEIGYQWKGVQYEIKDYYEAEDDGTQYTDTYGYNYKSIISIDSKSRIIWVEVINNDCTYHNEGDEINFILNIFYELLNLNAIERCDENGSSKI